MVKLPALAAVFPRRSPCRRSPGIRHAAPAAFVRVRSLDAGRPAVRDADLTEFLAGLALAWKAGEVRPTHTAKPRPARTWRSRKDPFEEVWLEITNWLEAEPDQVGVELFARLQRAYPARFPDGQLRTLQRRLADWRLAAASRLVFRDLHPQPPIQNLARSQLTHEVEGGGQPAPLKAEVPAPSLHTSLPQ